MSLKNIPVQEHFFVAQPARVLFVNGRVGAPHCLVSFGASQVVVLLVDVTVKQSPAVCRQSPFDGARLANVLALSSPLEVTGNVLFSTSCQGYLLSLGRLQQVLKDNQA